MRPLCFLALILAMCAACERRVTIGSSDLVVWLTSSGSDEFPFVVSRPNHASDVVVAIKATHLRSGKVSKNELRLNRVSPTEWMKQRSLSSTPSAPGVSLTMSYSETKDGKPTKEDKATIVIPFLEEKKGSDGIFEYEARWEK